MNILFMCVANSARSQMAEALAKDILGEKVTVMSAGIHPAVTVHSEAVAAMEEIGFDISSAKPKLHGNLPPSFLANLDYVITVCEEELCPELTTRKERLRWSFPDPVLLQGEEQKQAFREIRNELEQKIFDFGHHHQLLA
ncbi:protein tyrosine phosphatase [Stanieria cyanosphaera PCC 7437]|uniref:Protein tyrosine phosphatase n=1 Tax=Stanieria cyanosphaera (strain ATCC 29371 / PCC 7437) TaxID=111780 RepID=K9XR66_STAC7|nr:arsenate reductase ArsC [Stanieria cyanosphaera]AFZ34564.1 protein tyrosine phosphatase [Stanieria cyanosphaera PCC 7437]